LRGEDNGAGRGADEASGCNRKLEGLKRQHQTAFPGNLTHRSWASKKKEFLKIWGEGFGTPSESTAKKKGLANKTTENEA